MYFGCSATQWGNATDQVDIIAKEIMSIPELSRGFGQS